MVGKSLLTLFALFGSGFLMAAQNLTWTDNTGYDTWNTSDPNWNGESCFAEGDNVIFSNVTDKRGSKTIFIGASDGTPIDVEPGTVQWLNSGKWFMSGGGITGGASLNIGWDANVTFTGYTDDILTFTGGTTIASGWLSFEPTASGVYQFGRGPIIVSQRGAYVGLRFIPTVTGCVLTNDFIVPAGGAYWYGTCNGGKIIGNLQMDGPITLMSVGGTLASNRVDVALRLSGDRTFSVGLNDANRTYIYGIVDGGGVNAFTISTGGNTDTWTDYCSYVADDPGQPTPVWNISGFSKRETGNTAFKNRRNLGKFINLRTGCLILGGSGVVGHWFNSDAELNFQGGKLLLRRDTSDDQTESARVVNLQWGYNELRLTATKEKVYTLELAEPLTRANFATALVAANDLGGSGAATGSGRVLLPETPPLVGGNGVAGEKNISIVPFLIGGLTTDNAKLIQGDAGSTFVTFDVVSGSLRNLNTATEFSTSIADAVADENVRITSSETLTADAVVNSLCIDGSGGSHTLDGGHSLTVNSGAILYRGTAANVGTIDTAALDFGGHEGVVNVVDTLPSAYGATRLNINSVIQNGSLTKSGYGRLDLYGDNTFSGPFVVNSGQGSAINIYGTMATTNVQFYNGGTYLQDHERLPSETVVLIDSRATLFLNSKTQTVANVRHGPSGGGTLNIGATGVLRLHPIEDAVAEGAFSGSITAGTVIKEGTNVAVLAGNLNPALLRLEEGVLWRKAGSSGNPTKTVFAGGMYERAVNHNDWAYNTAYVFEAGGGWSSRGNAGKLVTIRANAVAQWGVTAGFLADGMALMFNTVNSDGCIRYEAGINLGNTAGTPQMREVRVADNPDSDDDYAYIQGQISGTAADKTLWKTGDGLLQINVNNAFAGGMKISGGMVQVGGNDNTFGVVPGVATTNVTLDGGGLRFGAAVTLHDRRIFLLNPGKRAVLDTVTGTVNIKGAVTGGDGGAVVVKAGSGTLNLSGFNDYVAANVISNGVLTVGSATGLGAAGNDLEIVDGTLNMNGFDVAAGALRGGAGGVVGNTAASAVTNTLTVDFAVATAVYDGVINDGTTRETAFTKNGKGTQILNGDNGYSGLTTVLGGALYLNGANATRRVEVSSGATLGGAGSVAGDVLLAGGATLAPGRIGAVGTLAIGGSLVLAEETRLVCKAGGETLDFLDVGGTVTIPTNGVFVLQYIGGGWPAEMPLLTGAAVDGASGYTLKGWSVELPQGISGSVGVTGNTLYFRRTQGTVLLLQ